MGIRTDLLLVWSAERGRQLVTAILPTTFNNINRSDCLSLLLDASRGFNKSDEEDTDVNMPDEMPCQYGSWLQRRMN